MTTFYVVRHGETDWNTKKLMQGQTDIPLNDQGELQAKNLAQELKHIKFDVAFSSDLVRAYHTTEIIALEHALAVTTTELLRERKFGPYEGKPFSTLEMYDELKQLSQAELFKHKFAPGVESDEEIVTRLLTFLRETAVAHPGKNVLVGTHGGIIRAFLIHLGHILFEERQQYKIANTAYVKLRSDGVEFFIDNTKGIDRI